VTILKNLSGFSWDEENGIVVTSETRCAWSEITKASSLAHRFNTLTYKVFSKISMHRLSLEKASSTITICIPSCPMLQEAPMHSVHQTNHKVPFIL